jgi:hypothetical protein
MKLVAAVLILIAFLHGNGHAEACRQASILDPVPFMGNDNEIFRLDDGSLWRVTYEYEYLYEYYPGVVICPDRGKLIIKGRALAVVPVSPGRTASPSGRSGRSQARSASQVVVVAVRSGCHDYFVADGPQGYYLLEWYGGYSPDEGDVIIGELGSYGFKDVFYPRNGAKGRLYVDDFLLSQSSAIEKYAEKCS